MTPPTNGDAPSPQLPDGVAEALEEARTLLEAGNHHDFLQHFAHPAELETVLAGRSFERLLTSFEKSKAEGVLSTIRHLQQAAVVELDGPTVILSSQDRDGRLELERVDGRWCFRNEGSDAPPRRPPSESDEA